MAKQNSEEKKIPVKSGMQLLAEKMSKTAIDEGTTYDPKVIDELGAGREGEYTGLEKNYTSVDKDFFDPYEDYIDKGTLKGGQYDLSTLNRLRADNQSNWEQLGNGLGRVAYNIIPQIASGIASMVDIQGYWDAEHAAQNELVNRAANWKKEVDENIFPIYEENPNGSMQLGDFAWWASRGSGLVESVLSFLAQGAGAAKLSSLGLKGLSKLGGRQLSKAIIGAKGSKVLFQGAETLSTAVMLNQSEAVIESSQVFRDTYDERIKLGYSAEDANKAAAAAASSTMNLNRINILLNLTSAGAFLKPFKGTRSLLTSPSLVKTAGEIIREGGQEAVEELINHVAAKKGMAVGRGKSYGFDEALEDIGSMEGFEAAFLGAIGGIAQTGGTKILQNSKYGPGSTTDNEGNRISRVQDEKNRYSEQQEVINSLKEKGVSVTDTLKDLKDTILFQEKLNKAVQENDQAAYDSLKEDMFENQALKAFKSGTTDILENLYQQEVKKPTEEVGEDHKLAAQNAIKNLKELEKVYNNYEDYVNVDEIFYNRANKIRLDRNTALLEKEKNQAATELNKEAAIIARNYRFNESQDVLIKEEGELKETIKKNYSVPIPFSIENLEENIGSTEENRKIYDKFLEEVKGLVSYKDYKSLTEQINSLDDASIFLQKEFSKITDSKYQEEFLKEQAKKEEISSLLNKVNSTTSISELEKIRSSISDPELNTAVENKIAQLKEDQNKELNKKKKELIIENTSKKIDNISLEEIDSIREEIYSLQISKDDKDILLDQVNRRIEVLNGNQPEVMDDPLGAFSFESPEERESKIKQEEEIYKTTVPKDIPNNNTEKSDVEKELTDAVSKLKEAKSINVNDSSIVYEYSRVEEGNNRAAYLSREFNQKSDLGTISREEISDSLDNLQVLDPDKLLAGTSITLKIKSDYEGDKYNPDSNTKEKIQWKVRELELEQKYGENYRTSNEYISEVPIVATDSNGEELFYVHDLSWIKEENVGSDPEAIKKDRNKLFAIRSEIAKKGQVKTNITYKGFGKLFKTLSGKSISVSEAMPDKNLVLAIGQDGNFKMWGNPSKLLKGNNEAQILNPNPKDGRLYAIVPVGPKENIAIPLERQLLSEEAINSIIKAINIYLENDSNNSIVKEIGSPSSLNINLLELSGLSQYLSRFIHLVSTEGISGLSPLLDVNSEELNSAVPLITVTPTGIEFGRPGINDQLAGRGKKVVTISRNFQETDNEIKNEKAKEDNLKKLAKLKTHLSKMLNNADKNTLQSKGKTAIITTEDIVKTIPYTEYIKQTFTTNIQSANIGTEENPNWIYTIQPTILFDTTFSQEEVKKNDNDAFIKAIEKKKVEGESFLESINNPQYLEGLKYKKNIEIFQNIIRSLEGREDAIKSVLNILYDKKKPGEENSIIDAAIKDNNKEIEKIKKSLKNINKIQNKFNKNLEDIEKDKLTKLDKNLFENKSIEQQQDIYNNIIRDIVGWNDVRIYSSKSKEWGIQHNIKISHKDKWVTLDTGVYGELGFSGIQSIYKIIKNYKKTDLLLNYIKKIDSKLIITDSITLEDLYNIFSYDIKEESNSLFDELGGEQNIEDIDDALELANANEITLSQLKGMLSNMDSGISIPGLTLEILKKAIQIREERSTISDEKIQVGDLEIDLEDGDLSDDDIYNSVPNLTQEQIDRQKQEIDSLIILGIDPRTQQSLISYLASKVIQKSLEQKELTGDSTINIKSIFAENKINFSNLSKLCKEKGLINKADRLDNIINQFDKVQSLTQQYLSLLSTGTISDINTDDNDEGGGLERTSYSDDWTFTVSSKNTASADLKKFFSYIEARNEKGVIKNPLGFPEIISFDEVYDTLHEILANKPSDYRTMMEYLEIYQSKFPWIQSVIERLNQSSEKIQNEFVSDMAKHSIDMRFIMWSKDKNGYYSLQDWSSNASSTEQRIRAVWNSNLKGVIIKTPLVSVDSDSNYIFNQTTVNKLVDQAKRWGENPPVIKTELKIKSFQEISEWLNHFGIELSNETMEDLASSKFINKERLSWESLFKNNNGLIKVLAKELERKKDLYVDESELLNDTVVKQLSRLEASNTLNVFSNSFQAGGKTIYSYGNNNYLVNRMRDLTAIDTDGNFINQNLIDGLKSISFTQDALWLQELTSNDEIGKVTRNTLSLNYLSLEALKKKFTPSQDNRKLNKLTTAEHEVAKTAFFFNNSGNNIDGEKRRLVRFFYPTMSDKSTMLTIQALSRELKLDDQGGLSKENLQLLYDAIVIPEIKRIQAKQADNVQGYEPNYFYFIPSLNTLPVSIGNTTKEFRDIIIDKTDLNSEIKEQVLNEIKNVFEDLITKKLDDWNKLGIGLSNAKEKIHFSFIDKGYISKVAKGGDENSKLRYCAMDYVYNYMIANAESYKLFAGDPAMYAKFKKNKSLDENLAESFINMGKRLAGDIAPGIELANSKDNNYYQVFFNDKKINSNNVEDSIQLEYFSKIMSDFKDNYSDLEGSDAQEYTTWKEHLFVMRQLGRLTTSQYDLFYSKLNGNKPLTYDELGTILQPIKPVYVGNILDAKNNIDKRIYIKSSSFPLIPQLTSGLEIDKIRKSLEKFEISKSKETSDGFTPTVRASFATANKVGAIKNAVNIFDKNGNVVDNLEINDSHSLLLSRENFRIQQDVPYKREKEEINIGTQERKLLFVNLLDVQVTADETGEQLLNRYNNNYKEIFEYNQKKLINTLGIKNDEIPAEKLAEILMREVTTRTGYPLNMLSALELNESKTDFLIPLWASPYASKFESLLTSLVNNKVVKQKFPGHSYVLGSQEGFKIKEEDDIDLSDSGIVFSPNFDPVKGLKPMRYDPSKKTILPAQIMIPFKFRDESGDILNLKDFTKEEDGRTILDFEKIPEKVLTLFGFRIPTQERNSMSAIEIVGFLPEASGDLILAPRDFTKQMGSDFDVDKLYTYMYNTYYKDGKINTEFESNQETIEETIGSLREELQNLKKEIKITEEEEDIINRHIAREDLDEENGLSNILNSLGRRGKEEVVSKLKETILNLSILERSYKASRQNKILDIHLQVMTSNNPEVISSIMALDSFGEFEPLSKEVNNIRIERGLIPSVTTILSETYQRTKYINATAGKDGVGTFSLDSTFNSSAQGKNLIYLELDQEALKYLSNNPNLEHEKILSLNNDIATFGNITSKGDISNKYTLRSQQIIKKAKGRSLTKEERDSLKMKSTIIRALQSSAVDNEKAQILDKLNINNETFDTIRALTILGFEEEDIVGLLTQEIIWEYIDSLKNAQSSLSGFTENVSELIVENLKTKYDPYDRFSTLEDSEIQLLSSSSGKQLLDNIKNKKLIENPEETPDFNLEQILLLDKFLKLQEIGKTIKQVQSAINSESKGIPKSLLEVNSKMKQVSNLPSSIRNVEKLLGEWDYSKPRREFKPTTINGFATYYGTELADNIFQSYFPYKNVGFTLVTNEIIEHSTNGKEISQTKQNTLRQDIFSDIKSYLFANSNTGLFTENANLERNRLFIDTDKNKSLANILNSLYNQEWYQQNGFLNKLTYDLNQNGTASRIYFESSTGENFDERNIYLGFLYLLDKNFTIGTFNGIEYTTRTLAQELIAAAFLEGGEQGAKQYLKYIPVSYLKSTEFGNYLNSISFDFDQVFGAIQVGDDYSYLYPSNFTRQYFQNNPSNTKTISIDDIEGKPKEIPSEFKLNKEALQNNIIEITDPFAEGTIKTQTHFISIYDNKAIGKYSLYEFDSVSRSYKRIPVVSGSYGFSQYNSEFPLQSVFEKNAESRLIEQIHPDYIKPEAVNENIINTHQIQTGKDLIIKTHLNSKDGLNDILNQLELSDSVSSYNKKLIEEFRKKELPKDFSLVFINKKYLASGSYNFTHNQLMLNKYDLDNFSADKVATTILHELTHTYTARAIDYYEKGHFNLLTKEQIKIIESIKDIKKQYIEYLVKSEGGEKLTAYHRSVYIDRYNAGQITKETLISILEKGVEGLDKKYDFNIEEKTLPHSKYYGAVNTAEFVTQALTDPQFQNHLNEVKYEGSKSFWSKLVDSLINLLDALGIKIKKDSLLPVALEQTLKLMETEMPKYKLSEESGESENFSLNEEEYQKYLLICGK